MGHHGAYDAETLAALQFVGMWNICLLFAAMVLLIPLGLFLIRGALTEADKPDLDIRPHIFMVYTIVGGVCLVAGLGSAVTLLDADVWLKVSDPSSYLDLTRSIRVL